MMLVKDYFNTETLLLGTRLSRSWDRAYMLSSIPPIELGVPVRNVFVDTTLKNTARLHNQS